MEKTKNVMPNDDPISWEELYKTHKGQWVALQEDEQTVIASAPTAKEAMNEAKTKGFSQPIMAQMPDNLIPFVGNEVQV